MNRSNLPKTSSTTSTSWTESPNPTGELKATLEEATLEEATLDTDQIIAMASAVLETEADGIRAMLPRIDQRFVAACELLLHCRGRIVVSGMGKSGHIGSKIAATLASTGSPAFFVHPAEASHGDLGMIRPEDVFIALSYSGNSNELLTIIPIIKRFGIPLIALTGNLTSPLATAATVILDVSVEREACPMGLAPTTSTTATLAMGDALAIALLSERGFDENDFALSHPGGTLGRKLLMRVTDVMATGDQIPKVTPGTSLSAALMEISAKGLGFVLVVDDHAQLKGVFTDGDLRRTIDRGLDIRSTTIDAVMTKGGRHTGPDELAAAAVALMQEYKISALPVVDESSRVCGALNMHALLSAGVV